MKRLILMCLLATQCLVAYAHKPSDSYLNLAIADKTVTGQWDIALRDLDFALGLDANGDAAITWGEVRSKFAEIDAYALARLTLQSNAQTCPLAMTEHLIDDHTDGAYLVLRFKAECAQPITALQARYALFFDIDPLHKGLLRLQYQGASRAAIFSPERATQLFTLARPSRVAQFFDYAREGVWHIWLGFDHILFLLALLLPAVVVRKANHWEAVAAFRPAFWSVLKIVTAFTLAHSITLTLATLGVISLPSRWV
ncbi:MAG: HupE/UreJ family protein, partial [Pseudomonadota bacterium]|nr:HupE/UreJ family protein [Pseudomonadota bacterium]